MLRKLLLPFLFVAFFASTAFAQTGSITGTVTNQDGKPVPTANVLLVEISRGAATNLQGEYTIEDVEPGTYTLRVTFVGYKAYTTQVTIEAGETLEKNVTMQLGAVGLQELVVTGYGGRVSKTDITGSIATVDPSEVKNVPVHSPLGLLQGRAAGVQVTSTSGAPGSGFEIRIRGVSSINAGNTPLYIVDGVPISTQEQSNFTDQAILSSLDVDDIESIQVLKDAAAAAIYGARAANGVVLITTKNGIPGETRISMDYEQGYSIHVNSRDLLTGPQWAKYYGDIYNADPLEYASGFGRDYTHLSSVNQLPTYDWRDFYYRTGVARSFDATVSGGSQDLTYYISGGIKDVTGSIINSSYRRYDFRVNLDGNFTESFSGALNISLNNQHYNSIDEDGSSIAAPVASVNWLPPVYFPYLSNGEVNPNAPFGRLTAPALVMNNRSFENNTTGVLGNLSLSYEILPWLSLNGQLGVDYRVVRDVSFVTPTLNPSEGGDANGRTATITSLDANATLNFRQTIAEEHNISGLVGIEYIRDRSREISASAIGFSTGSLLPVISAGATPESAEGDIDEFRVASYFGQLKYNYDQRYRINLTLRYDGSSRFGSKNRWGLFPSVGVAWSISEEDFFNADFVESLKLRASYGEVGNSSIDYYRALGTYEVAGVYKGLGALAPSRLANNLLTWEEKHTINLGVDYSLFNGRLYGSVDVYRAKTTSLLLERPLPTATGFGGIFQNVGAVQNRGVEIGVNSINISSNDFMWSTNVVVSFLDNKILSLNKGQKALEGINDTRPFMVGHPMNAWKVARWAGVNPADGRPMWYDKNGNITYDPDPEDRVFFGRARSDIVGGFGNRFSFKGFTLNVRFSFEFGKLAFPATYKYFFMTPNWSSQQVADVLLRWQKPGDITRIPRIVPGDSPLGSANWRVTFGQNVLYNASYIKLQTIGLSYNLPSSLTENINLRGIRLYVVGQNLYTWTAWKGLDVSVAGTSQQASYPSPLNIRAGIEIDF